jgi:hypothetical protein
MSTRTEPSSQEGGLRPWHLFLVTGLAASTAAVTLASDTRPSNLIMLSLTAFSAVLVAVAFHRTLQPFGSDDTAAEPAVLSARARAELEREKMLVLRSIKELEFDRAMGKVADADFAEMVGRLRARAISLMAKLDAEAAGYRGLIERDLQARLAQAGVTAVSEARMEAPAGAAVPAGARAPSVLACSACGTGNDEDARFCKSCGAKLDANAVSM